MFYLYLKSLLSHKDSVSQASQERSSLIYYKLNGHSICPSSILYLLKIFHRDFPSYPISISRVPLGILEILRSRLQRRPACGRERGRGPSLEGRAF